MEELFLTILLLALQGGSSTPATRVSFDAENTGDVFSPVITRQDLWDLYGGHFSATPRISQFDMFQPTAGQLQNLRYNFNWKNQFAWLSQCDNIDSSKKPSFLLSNGQNDGVRCRRTVNGWSIEEPMYVDEPGWILVENELSKNLLSRRQKSEDPFYIARGKRSYKRRVVNNADDPKKKTNSTRTKREASMRAKLNSRMILDGDESFNDDAYPWNLNQEKKEKNQNGYLEPRDKHSDILDMLQDPYFISRGKKNSDEMPRDRRGDVEQLLKDQDPFYVARGRRTSNRVWFPMILDSQQCNSPRGSGFFDNFVWLQDEHNVKLRLDTFLRMTAVGGKVYHKLNFSYRFF